MLEHRVQGCDAGIHLACISNDPSFELNPALSRPINYEAFGPLVSISKESGVRRFINASTCSVYGVSNFECYPRSPVRSDHGLPISTKASVSPSC
jgi:nucleoside-diphosphate-sugar epimerase